MTKIGKRALVIGATGLLGLGASRELNRNGWNVKAMGKKNLTKSSFFTDEIEYVCGDFYDESFLTKSLEGIDKVFFFLSSTFPSTSSDSLDLEINRTLNGLDYLLRKMKELGIKEIVFPSSGGAIYGNVNIGAAKETDKLRPATPYGFGKMMCEDVLRFYSGFGISSTILRVGNVYGTPMIRTKTQGVIDIFIQKAITGQTATVWGDALSTVRDYIFIDDFSEALCKIAEHQSEDVEIYNLSSGIGTSLEEIIDSINKYSDKHLMLNRVENDFASGISRIVLDICKFYNLTGWSPKHDIDSGIAATIERKKRFIY